MRVIIDVAKNKAFKKSDDDNRSEKPEIAEIDFQSNVGLNIFLWDKKNTIITISEEDLTECLKQEGFI